jgi:hypothetical protein
VKIWYNKYYDRAKRSLAYPVGLNPTHLTLNQQGGIELSMHRGNNMYEAKGTE